MTDHVPCWWSMSEERLLELLRRTHDGEDPDLLYAQEYANANITQVGGNEET